MEKLPNTVYTVSLNPLPPNILGDFSECVLSVYSTVCTVYVCTAFVFIQYLTKKPDIYRCICSNRVRLGYYAKIQIIVGTVLVCGDSDYCWDSIGMRRFRLLLDSVSMRRFRLLLGQCKYAEIQIIVGKFCSKRPEQFTHIFHSFFQKKSYIKHAKIFLQKLDFRFFSQKCFVQIAHSLISSELP